MPTTIPTTRRFPRTLREAFPHENSTSAIGISGPVEIPTRRSLLDRFADRMDALDDQTLRRYVARFMLALIVAEIAFVVWLSA